VDGAFDLCDRGLELGDQEVRALELPGEVGLVDLDPRVGARDDDDAVLSVVVDHDQRGARRSGGVDGDGGGVDAVARERLAQRASVIIVAHATHELHLGALSRTADGLVAALAAGDAIDRAALQRLAGCRRMRHAQHQVHVEAAEHHDAWRRAGERSHRVSERRCRGRGGGVRRGARPAHSGNM
jgi:hypothetical protein